MFNFKVSYIGRFCSWWWGSRWKSAGDVSVLASNSQKGCGDDSEWKRQNRRQVFLGGSWNGVAEALSEMKSFRKTFLVGASSLPAAAAMNPNCHITLIVLCWVCDFCVKIRLHSPLFIMDPASSKVNSL